MLLTFPRLRMAMPLLAAALCLAAAQCLAIALAASPAANEQDVTIEKPKVGDKGDKKAGDKKADDKKADDKSSSDKPADEKADEKKEEHPSGKTHTVARGPFKLEVSLEASLAGAQSHEIAVDPDTNQQLSLRQVVPHGTRVTKGQTLLKFDTLKLDEQIRDLEAARGLAELTLQQARRELELLARSAPLDTELAAQAKKHADEDLERFEKLDRAFDEKAAAFSMKSASQYLEYSQEELKQLEKMYKADDLTEETEEIILKRARNDVDQMKFMVEQTNFFRDREMQVLLPRSLLTHQRAAAQAGLLLERSKATQPLAIEKQKLEVQKQEFELKKDAEELERLRGDLKRLTVASPADGVAYYGRWQSGRWTGLAEIGPKLRPGGPVQPYEVLLTVVEPGNLRVHADVPEKELAYVRSGIAGNFVAKALPKQKLAVQVEAVSPAPQDEGEFGAVLTFDAAPPKTLVAGMTGDVKITAYFKADALTVPVKAVFQDEADDEKRFVYLSLADDKHERRDVTVGHESETLAEITAGLAAGDKILLEKPEE
jgi:multidrug efflux pump subunit AcrA (membrane-fusion protein)